MARQMLRAVPRWRKAVMRLRPLTRRARGGDSPANEPKKIGRLRGHHAKVDIPPARHAFLSTSWMDLPRQAEKRRLNEHG
jgi:hypothetical protein